MLSEQEKRNYEVIKAKLRTPPIHISEKEEKFNYAKRQEENKKIRDSIPKTSEKTVWFNTLKKRIPVSKITESMMFDEEMFGEYLYNNDIK